MNLTINGKQHQINSANDTPLLWVLREELGMLGTKFGCGKGLCGACTVHANGQAVRSCQLPVSAASSMQITTIESLGTPDALHPVQKVWCELNVPQCGYCQPGQIMSALALLNQNKNPSDSDIDMAMQGNICRCGTYPRIRAAIKQAGKEMHSVSARGGKR